MVIYCINGVNVPIDGVTSEGSLHRRSKIIDGDKISTYRLKILYRADLERVLDVNEQDERLDRGILDRLEEPVRRILKFKLKLGLYDTSMLGKENLVGRQR